MFTAAEFRLIRERCLADFQNLLATLKISEPNWNSGAEFQIYENLDNEIVARICRLMKSESIIDGYTKLLTLGSIDFNFSETDNELLAKILKNSAAVIRGATQVQASSAPAAAPRPSKIQKTVEETVKIPGLIFLGILIIVAGIVLLVADFSPSNEFSTPGGIMLAILGAISLTRGLVGRKIKRVVEVEAAPVSQAPTTNSLPAPFSRAEIQQTLEVLAQVQKIIQSI